MKNLLIAIILSIIVGVSVFGLQEYRYKNSSNEVAPMDRVTETKEIKVKSDLDEKLPVVIYSPGGLFTVTEKNELKSKLIDPFFDFENDDEIDFISMMISKEQNPEVTGYTYTVDVISKDGVHLGFLFGSEGIIEWWTPTCMGPCTFPEGYQEKYPEVVALSSEQ